MDYFKPLVLSVCVLGMQSAFATNYFIIQKNVQFPDQFYTSHEAVATYTITNKYARTGVGYLRNLAKGLTVLSTNDPDSCQIQTDPQGNSYFNLAYDASDPKSCNITLAFETDSAKNETILAPQVCTQATGNVGCNPTLQSFSIADSIDKPSAVAMTAGNSYFAPSAETEIVVTNSSADLVANDVRLVLPKQFLQYVDTTKSTLRCNEVQPQKTCQFDVFLKSNAPTSNMNFAYDIEGANTQPIQQMSTVLPSLLKITPAFASQPGALSIGVTNVGTLPISNLQLPTKAWSSLHNVTYENTDCPATIEPGAPTCHYNFIADDTAYGSAVPTISFTNNSGETKTLTTHISIARPSLIINTNGAAKSDDVLAGADNKGTFRITNNSKFYVNNIAITHSGSAQGFKLIPVPGKSCQAGDLSAKGLAPGDACFTNFEFVNTKQTETHPKGASVAIAPPPPPPRGIYVNTPSGGFVQTNVIPDNGLVIGADEDLDMQHLSYKAIQVYNRTGAPVKLTSITETASNDYVLPCNDTDNKCLSIYADTCAVDDTLDNNDFCILWSKASAGELTSDKTGDLNVEIVAQTTDSSPVTTTYDSTIPYTYNNSLYVGGSFQDTITSNLGSYVTRFDGVNWHSLGEDSAMQLNGTVQTLYSWHGDLYVGGLFTEGDGDEDVDHIGYWNGDTWNPLGSGFNGPVYALHPNADEDALYVGGQFNEGDDIVNIASWDGSAYSSVGGGIQAHENTADSAVYAIGLNQSDKPVIGGTFQSGTDCIGSGAPYYLAVLSGSDCWVSNSPSWHDVNNTVYALTSSQTFSGSGYDYNWFIGGNMTGVNATWAAFGIQTMSPIGGITAYTPKLNIWLAYDFTDPAGTIPYFTGGVHALHAWKGHMYLGGSFTQFGTDWNNIAELSTDFTDARALNTGTNDSVNALTVTDDYLYAGGKFTTPANRVAKWDGNTWFPLGAGISNGNVYAMEIQPQFVFTQQ